MNRRFQSGILTLAIASLIGLALFVALVMVGQAFMALADGPHVAAVSHLFIEQDDGGLLTRRGGTTASTLPQRNASNPDATGVGITETVPLSTTFAPGVTDVITRENGKGIRPSTAHELDGLPDQIFYSGNLLTQISGPAGRPVSFGYTSGRLNSVTGVDGQTTTYAYDANGRLQSITDANGHTFVHNTYDAEDRVIEQRHALNNLSTFSYYTATRHTVVTDPRGFSTVYQYDSASRVVAETDPLSNTVSYALDVNSFPSAGSSLERTKENASLPEASATIRITEGGFDPAQVSIQVGDTVAWINQTEQVQRVIGKPVHRIYLPLLVRGSSGTQARGGSTAQSAGSQPWRGQTDGQEEWDSGELLPGEVFTHTFTLPGAHSFYLAGQIETVGLVLVEASLAGDFALRIEPTDQIVVQGQSVSYTVTVRATGGFAASVALSVTGLPTGTLPTWSVNPVTPTGTSLLTLATAADTPTGTHTFTVTGSGGGHSHDVQATLPVEPLPPMPEFQLAAWPATQTITRGHSLTYTVAVTALHGFGQPVALVVGGAPDGATVTWGSNPVTPTADAALAIIPSVSGPTGTFTLVITGTADVTHTAQAELVVVAEPTPPAPDFELAAWPLEQSVVQGRSVTYTVRLTAVHGFMASVALAVDGLPEGTTAVWSDNPVTPTASAMLTLTTALTTPVGTYGLLVSGAGSGLAHTAPITLSVLPHPDFALDVLPTSQTITRGHSVTYTVTITVLHGFSEPVTLDVRGTPDGAAVAWGKNPITPTESTFLHITPSATGPTGTNALVITGTGGSLSHASQAELVVVAEPPAPVPDFNIGVWPTTRAVTQGGSVTYTVALTANYGFTAPVALAVGGLPAGTTAVWRTNPVTPTGQTAITLTAALTPPLGTYPLVITGAGGGFTHTADLTMTVLGELPDLIVESIQTDPALPVEGQPALITVTLRNLGAVGVGPFEADWYVNLPSPPGVGDRGVVSWAVASLGPGAGVALTTTYVFTPAGEYALWAQADTLDAVGEGDESNNVNGPLAVTVLSRVQQVCGSISQDTTWYGGIVYVVTCNVTVQAGVTLTLESGAVVKFNSGRSMNVNGNLLAQGTVSGPVYFTSYYDDSVGGDSNGDGSATSPAPADWSYLRVSGGTTTFDYSTIRYGGGSWCCGNVYLANNADVTFSNGTISHSDREGIYLEGSNISLTLVNAVISDNNTYGVYSYNASNYSYSVDITYSTISNNASGGLRLNYPISGVIRYSSILGNGSFGVSANPVGIVDARYNYWGSDNGPAPYGSGDAINTYQKWDPVCKCNVTYPAVFFIPWLDSHGNVAGPPLAQSQGARSSATSRWVSDPVNVVFGNYTYQYTDLAFPTFGEDFAFQRTYNSGRRDNGPFGPGWTHSYHITATQTSTNTVVVQREDGRKDLYTDDTTGNYLAPPGIYDALTWDTDHFVLTRKDQVIYTFNPDGTLASIADSNHNTTTLTYTGGKLTTLTEPTGRQVVFAYSANLLTQISDPAGRTVSFGYTSGRLTSVTGVDGRTTTYAYDAAGRLQSITDANGHTFVHNTYDAQDRVIEQRDALNNLSTFSYYIPTRQTTVTDPRGYATVYEYDSAFRVVAETDPLSNTVSYAFDVNNNRTQVTDKRGNETDYAYDGRGNVLSITDPLGGVTSFAYNTFNSLLSEMDALGNTTSYQYDANQNLTRHTDALSNQTSWTYDALGQVTSATDALGNTTGFGYDVYGHQRVITDALGYTTVYTYDIVGRMSSETDAQGHTTAYTYDSANRLLSVTDPLGGVQSYTYDAVGNRASVTDPNGGVTAFVYDEKDRLANVIDPLGHTITYNYDAVNNQIAVTDPLNHTTSYVYDALSRRTSVSDPLGNTTSYTYDADGNRTALSDANGHVTTYAYDARNQLVTVTDAEGGGVAYAYDPVGNRIEMTDANGHVTHYSYDALNRLATVTDPLSYAVSYGYDPAGNRIARTKADGAVINYTNDPLNRLVTTITPSDTIHYAYDGVGNRTVMTDSLGVTVYTYDDLDRLIQVSAPNGTLAYAYDANSNRTGLTYPDGKVVTYTYDLANRVATVADWSGRSTVYTYDAASRQTGILYPNGVQASYNYDNADRLLRILHTSPVSGTIAVFTYTLDNVGNRLAMQDLDGTTSYLYDDLYRLIQVTYPDSEIVDYAYDPMGNRTAMTSTVSGVVTYTYDAGDRLLSAGALIFTWDANGNMIGKGSAVYAFDDLDRLSQVVSGTTTVQFAYDGDGVRLGKIVNGTATTCVQDVAAPLPVVLAETTAGQSSQYVYGNDLLTLFDPTANPFFYHYDGLGSTRALSNLGGQTTDAYSYDVFGAVRSHNDGTVHPFVFTGEQVDRETELMFLRARYYDSETGRFLTRDRFAGYRTSIQSLNRYAYALNNPVRFKDPGGNSVISEIWQRYVSPFGQKVIDYTPDLAEHGSWYLKATGDSTDSLVPTLDTVGHLGRIGNVVQQDLKLAEFARQATRDEDLYWAYRYARSLNPDGMPSRQEVEEIRLYDFHIEYRTNVRALRDLGRGTQSIYGNRLVNWLFPLKWKGPENDREYQLWLENYWQGNTSAGFVLGASEYRPFEFKYMGKPPGRGDKSP